MLKKEKTNIIFILADDLGYWGLGCAGNPELKTVNLDRLANEGIRFDNFFCVSPVCSPARASILTGRIPSQHGIHDWLRAGDSTIETDRGGKLIEYLKDQPGYTDILSANGYNCGISGKWHLGDSHHPQKGFEFWKVHATGGGPYYHAPMIRDGKLYTETRYVTDAITDHALEFLESTCNDSRPFCLNVNYTAPHSPWEREHHPPEIFDEYYENCDFDSLPAGLTPPEWVQRLNIPVEDAETRRVYLSGYYASITAMDANIGRLLEWLEVNDMRDNTLIIFSSDNGMNMGHHGVYGKGNATYPMNMFDTSVKVPMIISCPGSVRQDVVCEDLLSHYDIFPTLLDYLGLFNPEAEKLPGISFAPLLQEEVSSEREHVVIYDEYGPVRMIRNRNTKYIRRYPNGPDEFYDLINDPDESVNLIDQPDKQQQIASLRAEMEHWFDRFAVPSKDGKNLPVSGMGQLENICSGQYEDNPFAIFPEED